MANIRLFEHSSIAGRQLFIAHPGTARYLLAGGEYLNQFEFNDITSSVRLCADLDGPPQTCLLFEHDRFDGQFRAFAFNENRNIISLPYFNDLTSSVLLVSHGSSERFILKRIRESAGERINLTADKQLSGLPGFIRSGDVMIKFTIDAFEIGYSGTALIRMEIPLLYKPPYLLKKTDATLCFYTELYITTDNHLRAAVVGWHYKIEPGIFSNGMAKRLERQAQGMAGYFESSLNEMLHELSWQRWNDVYLLPGRVDRIDADYEGDVSDDCTVILVPMEKE
jgi:hypothetical protein